MNPSRPRCEVCEKPPKFCLCGKLPTVESPLPILVLQHPQEKREVLSTVPFLKLMVPNLKVRRGLSAPNLAKALGETAGTIKPSEWVVFYLGGKEAGEKRTSKETVTFIKPKDKAPERISGLIFLDGSWSEVKTLWWRNAWLLKCARAVLNPPSVSLYGKHRREPRKECLSTLESVGLAVETLAGDAAFNQALCGELKTFLERLGPPRK